MSDHDKDTDDQSLSDLYASIGDEQPSAELDRRILSEAHNAVGSDKSKRHKGNGPFSRQWTVPVSLAAVIVLSVVVVMTIQREQPESLSSLPQPDVATSQSQPSADQQTTETEAAQPVAPDTKSELAAKPAPPTMAKARKEDKAPAVTTEKEAVSRFSYGARQQPEPLTGLSKSKPKSVISESRQSEPATQSMETESLADVQAKIARSTRGDGAAKDDAATFAGKSFQEEPPAETAGSSSAVVAESGPTASVRSPEMDTDREDQAAQTLTEEQSVPAKANRTFGSDAGEARRRKPALMSLAAPRESETKMDCWRLSESECVQSTECILDQDAQTGNYSCRAADNTCEHGFAQHGAARQQCEHNTGCVFVPANCYCAPEEKCECAGGIPAMCEPAGKSGVD